MTFTDAAAEVLRLEGRPLHYKEITDLAIEKNLLSHVGKSPEVTMGARLAATLKKDDNDNPLVRVKPGVFALREWDERTIKAGLEKKPKKANKGRSKDDRPEDQGDLFSEAAADSGEVEVSADEEVAEPSSEPTLDVDEDEDEPVVVAPPPAPSAAVAVPRPRPILDESAGPDEVMRAEAVAGAADIFDEEEDDDQPIFGGPDEPAGGAGADAADSRRRRRRRRRGRGAEAGATAERAASNGGANGGLPSYTATPAFDAGERNERNERNERGSRPQVIELASDTGLALDDIAGRDLADAIAVILAGFDRNAGAVSLRQIAEMAQRRGRLTGDAQLAQSMIAAAVRSDNHRRLVRGVRPRFRLAGGRVALTDWLLGGDLGRLEHEALVAVERYRDAARRAFARKVGELPGHAFVELAVLALERAGVSQLRAVRRTGVPGAEAHFSGILSTAGEQVQLAIVLRRDGREIGRERVTELRGSLHHYGPATIGWIMTAGQVLSGAREEAAVLGAAPIALFDGLAVARLCEEHDVAVIRATLPVAIPDVDLLEALRAC